MENLIEKIRTNWFLKDNDFLKNIDGLRLLTNALIICEENNTELGLVEEIKNYLLKDILKNE